MGHFVVLAIMANDRNAVVVRRLIGRELTDVQCKYCGSNDFSPYHISEADLKVAFSRMAEKFEELKEIYPSVDTLSMGMSGDIEAAIACGSTMVRVGTALFGERE